MPRESVLRTAEGAPSPEQPPSATGATSSAAADPRAAALGMADEAEEAAELVGYKAIAMMVKQVQGSVGEIASTVSDLIAAEQGETVAQTSLDEASETTVEIAKLGSMIAFCGHAASTLYGVQDLCRRMLTQSGAYGMGGEGMPMPSMLEAAEGGASPVGYLTRLGKALDKINLPDDHPQAAKLAATRARIEAAKNALSERAASAAPAAIPESPCGCGAAEGEAMTKTERVRALIAKGNTPFTEADQGYLETLCDGRLSTLEAYTPPTPAEPAVPATLDEFLASAPEALKPAVTEAQQIVAAQRAAAAQHKADLVSKLKTAQSAFSETELDAMAVDQLEKLARVAEAAKAEPETPAAVDFAGQGSPRAAAKNGDEDDVVPPPPDLTERIRAARAPKA